MKKNRSENKRTPKDSPAVYYSAIAERFSEIIAKKDKNIKKYIWTKWTAEDRSP